MTASIPASPPPITIAVRPPLECSAISTSLPPRAPPAAGRTAHVLRGRFRITPSSAADRVSTPPPANGVDARGAFRAVARPPARARAAGRCHPGP
ncbi:putative hypothetical protein [Streptomyces sp. NBRC 110611]|nr:putative hypothetical protein [Streptomyces sp. NBRC 110611]